MSDLVIVSKSALQDLAYQLDVNDRRSFVIDLKDLSALLDKATHVSGEPVAYLKEWKCEGDRRKRIDFHQSCEAWMERLGVTVAPLYTTPQVADTKDAERYRKIQSLLGNTIAHMAVTYFADVIRDKETLNNIIDKAGKARE